jgi:hypothetical protein
VAARLGDLAQRAVWLDFSAVRGKAKLYLRLIGDAPELDLLSCGGALRRFGRLDGLNLDPGTVLVRSALARMQQNVHSPGMNCS